jgi:4-hydroxy-2-oxoheptanedioate aldolase
MIEIAEAVKNVDDILGVPGIAAVYVGPSGLFLALGCTPKLDQTEAPGVEVQQRIQEARQRHNVIAGIDCVGSPYALKMIAVGYRFATLASGRRVMAARTAEEVAAVRDTGVGSGKLRAY